MDDLATLCSELETIWRRDIPLAAAIGIEVAGAADGELVVHAPLAPNRNLHGTAFAGSLFSVCVLTGWGAMWLALRGAARDGTIVVRDGRIRYRKAVTGTLIVRCRPDPDALAEALAQLAAEGRCALELECRLDPQAAPAVMFEATYVVHARDES